MIVDRIRVWGAAYYPQYILLLIAPLVVGSMVLSCPIYLVLCVSTAILIILAFKGYTFMMLIPFFMVSFIPFDFNVVAFNVHTSLGLLPPIIPGTVLLITVSLFRGVLKGHIVLNNRIVYISGIIFICFCLISWAINYPWLSGLKKITYLFLSSIGTLYLVENYAKKGMHASSRNLIAMAGLIVAIAGIVEFVFGYNPYRDYYRNFWWMQQHGQLWRIKSLIGNPLILSAYLMLLFAFLLFRIKDKTIYISITIALILTALIFTFSRTAYAALIITLLIYYGAEQRMRKNAYVLLSILLLTALIAISAIYFYDVENLILDRFWNIAQDTSILYRLESWSAVWDIGGVSDVLFGVGIAYVRKVIISESLLTIATFDNAFHEIFWEGGLFAALSYIFFIVSPCLSKKNISTRKHRILLLIVYTIFCFSFATYYYASIWITYWLLQSLLLMSEDEISEAG